MRGGAGAYVVMRTCHSEAQRAEESHKINNERHARCVPLCGNHGLPPFVFEVIVRVGVRKAKIFEFYKKVLDSQLGV